MTSAYMGACVMTCAYMCVCVMTCACMGVWVMTCACMSPNEATSNETCIEISRYTFWIHKYVGVYFGWRHIDMYACGIFISWHVDLDTYGNTSWHVPTCVCVSWHVPTCVCVSWRVPACHQMRLQGIGPALKYVACIHQYTYRYAYLYAIHTYHTYSTICVCVCVCV